MKRAGKFFFSLCLSQILHFIACSPAVLTQVWRNTPLFENASQIHRCIVFIQSDNQVNSRIEQDRFVRLCPYPSIQSYWYNRSERLIEANQEVYRKKLLQDNIDYGVIIRLADTPDSTGTGKLFEDYFLQIDPWVFNPVYQRPLSDYYIATQIYRISDGVMVWKSLSKKFPADKIPEAMNQNLMAVFRELKKI